MLLTLHAAVARVPGEVAANSLVTRIHVEAATSAFARQGPGVSAGLVVRRRPR